MQVGRQQKSKVRRLLIIGGVLSALFVFSLAFLLFLDGDSQKKSAVEKPASEQIEKSALSENTVKYAAGSDTTTPARELSRTDTSTLETESDSIIRPTHAQVNAYETKLNAIKALGYRLSNGEIDTVFELLNMPYRTESGVTAMQWDSIKNEAFNQLVKQETIPTEIYARLSSVWSNRNLSEPSREYAVQFYVLFLERSMEEETFNEKNLDHFSSALSSSKLQGTAMLGLGYLVDDYPDLLEFADLNEIAREVISSHSSPRARSAAIQTLIRTGNQGELAQITHIAVHSSDTVERLSAIAALGELGGNDEVQTIIQIENSETPLFANAAQVARNKIYSRIETNQAF